MRNRVWSFHSAEKHFDEVVDRALTEGPQFISHRGRQVVVLARNEFINMKTPPLSLLQFFRRSPLVGVRLDVRRDRSPIRRLDP